MRITGRQIRRIIRETHRRRRLMREAWNDDLTNMFADFLDWLQDAYEEKEKEAEATAGGIRWKPKDEEKFKATAEAMGIEPKEAVAVLEDPESAKSGDKNHAALLAAIYSAGEWQGLLESVMKDLQSAASAAEGMGDEDPDKAKEASDKAMEALGSSFGTAAGIANAVKGDYAAAFKDFVGGTSKVTGQKELHVWAVGISAFGKACAEMGAMLDKATSFAPDAEEVNAEIDGSVWKKAGPAISGEADKLAPILEEMAAAAEKAEEEGGGSGPVQVSKGDKAETDGILISDKQAQEFGIETQQEAIMRNYLKEIL